MWVQKLDLIRRLFRQFEPIMVTEFSTLKATDGEVSDFKKLSKKFLTKLVSFPLSSWKFVNEQR